MGNRTAFSFYKNNRKDVILFIWNINFRGGIIYEIRDKKIWGAKW